MLDKYTHSTLVISQNIMGMTNLMLVTNLCSGSRQRRSPPFEDRECAYTVVPGQGHSTVHVFEIVEYETMVV